MLDKSLKEEAETVLPIHVRTMLVAALNKVDARYRPRVLPVGKACGWLLDHPEEEWMPRVMLLDSVCISNKGDLGADAMFKKVDNLMDQVNNAETLAYDTPAPSKSAKELLKDVENSRPTPPDLTTEEKTPEEESGTETPADPRETAEGLDSFTSGAPASQLEPPAPDAAPPAPEPDPDPTPEQPDEAPDADGEIEPEPETPNEEPAGSATPEEPEKPKRRPRTTSKK